MPRYVRAEGSIFFFTVVLAQRPNRLLIDEIDRLRHIYKIVQQRHPFETVAICVLPDHIHALWALPEGDANFSTRWSSIKSGFSRGLDAQTRVADWPHSSFHRYVQRGLLAADWGGDLRNMRGSFGE